MRPCPRASSDMRCRYESPSFPQRIAKIIFFDILTGIHIFALVSARGQDILAKVFFAGPIENLDNFQKPRTGRKHSARLWLCRRWASAHLYFIRTGVEYDCLFLVTLVQNVRWRIRKRLCTFFLCYCVIAGPGGNKKVSGYGECLAASHHRGR